MPKEGYESLTIPEELNNRILKFVQQSSGIINNKTQAVAQAWQLYENMFCEYKNPKPVAIGNKLIGPNQPIFVIAEIGINHNGDINICKKMIDMAVECGCDAVKFQKRTPDICVPENQKNVSRDTPWGTMTYLEYRKRIEFEEKEYKEIDDYCKKKGIIWFASPWDVPSVDFLEKFNVSCYKVASACITDKELLSRIKDTGKPIILSTGMSTMEQINDSVKFIGEDHLILLHCTSTYPAKDNEHSLNVIKTLRKHFNCPVGYSGHESGVWATIVAASIGACVLERHITLDRAMYGSDQAASLEKKGLETICKIARIIPNYLGQETKKVFDSEKPLINKLRRVNSL